MDGPDSLSKGCFIYKPKKPVNPFQQFNSSKWANAFGSVWSETDERLKVLDSELSSNVTGSLIKFINETEAINKILTAVVLTGVNLPDHLFFFSQIVNRLKDDVTPHVAFLRPSMCRNVSNIVEHSVRQLISSLCMEENSEEELPDEESDEEVDNETPHVKKRDCNMPYLLKYFKDLNLSVSPRKKRKGVTRKIVIVLPDLEGFSSYDVLQDFILILSGYMKDLPICLVLGISTTPSTLTESLKHSVMSKLKLQLFRSEKSVHCLNQVINEVFLNKNCPFILGPNIFKFLCNVFLFYDFSVRNFSIGVKYCLMEHFFGQTSKVLCCKKNQLTKVLSSLSKSDLLEVTSLESFKKHVTTLSESTQEKLETNLKFLKATIQELLEACHRRILEFYLCLRLLHLLVADLPQAPLGKLLREVYLYAIVGDIDKLPAYKQCLKMLKFHSKEDLITRISKMIVLTKEHSICDGEFIGNLHNNLIKYQEKLEISDRSPIKSSPAKSPRKIDITPKSRSEFKKAIADLGKEAKTLSPYEMARDKFVSYMFEEVFPIGLIPVTSLPLHELLFCDGKVALRRRIVGCPRADVHLALTEPQHYLMCMCCKLDDPKQMLSSLPDICILYKLHLECGSLINLYDWLMSFSTVLNPDSEESDCIDPQVQARFTQAVAELEFLGFIKSSKRKKDHVSRLTWGSG